MMESFQCSWAISPTATESIPRRKCSRHIPF